MHLQGRPVGNRLTGDGQGSRGRCCRGTTWDPDGDRSQRRRSSRSASSRQKIRASLFTGCHRYRASAFQGGSITLKALTWKSPRSPAHVHKDWSTGLSILLTNITIVPQSAVSSVGFLWGSPPGRGLAGFLWGSQKATTVTRSYPGFPAQKMSHMLAPVPQGSGVIRECPISAYSRPWRRRVSAGVVWSRRPSGTCR
jgi:hypothetical protein